jgi:hypothetical protein
MTRMLFDQIDEAMERIFSAREALLREPDAPDRAERLALLLDHEARLWSQLYEITSLRLVWRAALAAELGARGMARAWRRQAELDVIAPTAALPNGGGRRAAA